MDVKKLIVKKTRWQEKNMLTPLEVKCKTRVVQTLYDDPRTWKVKKTWNNLHLYANSYHIILQHLFRWKETRAENRFTCFHTKWPILITGFNSEDMDLRLAAIPSVFFGYSSLQNSFNSMNDVSFWRRNIEWWSVLYWIPLIN